MLRRHPDGRPKRVAFVLLQHKWTGSLFVGERAIDDVVRAFDGVEVMGACMWHSEIEWVGLMVGLMRGARWRGRRRGSGVGKQGEHKRIEGNELGFAFCNGLYGFANRGWDRRAQKQRESSHEHMQEVIYRSGVPRAHSTPAAQARCRQPGESASASPCRLMEAIADRAAAQGAAECMRAKR